MQKVMYSSKEDNWATPQDFFDGLDAEFHFTLDPCADENNHKCERYYTKEQNGLEKPWGGVVFCNPPYGRDIIKWVRKAILEAEKGATVVMLLPARTDTRWFHHLFQACLEIRFVRLRLKFGGEDAAPFPSVVAVITPESAKNPTGRVRCKLY